MSAVKWIVVGTVSLFSLIGLAAVMKKKGGDSSQKATSAIEMSESSVLSVPSAKPIQPMQHQNLSGTAPPPLARPLHVAKGDFPHIDRVFQLFSTGPSKLPIVETLTYSSSVSWLKRPAWIADYATYYQTSRHFIARSLNGKPDYFNQTVSEKSNFNVFRKDKKIQFHLLVDVSRCKMGFYYVDLDTNERVLLKTYSVGLGRLEAGSPSGTLTPLGRFTLGNRVAIYQPGTMGFYQDQKVEMIRVFGTRWIPLLAEADRLATENGKKGYGLQGAPWIVTGDPNQLIENQEVIGAYDSDGCIRLKSEDIEEIYAIVLTKPTFVEIVKDFHLAKLPGVEVATPSR